MLERLVDLDPGNALILIGAKTISYRKLLCKESVAAIAILVLTFINLYFICSQLNVFWFFLK
jgi:hypothetical protein